MWSEFKEMEGTVWGYLTVCERVENDKWGAAQFRCVCRCGNETVAAGKTLRKGKKKSCGCLRGEIRTEFNKTEWVGYRKSNARIRNKLYPLWLGIRKRCYSQFSSAYKYYGGRGISVFDGWKDDFDAFEKYILTELGEKPSSNHSLDRIENNGNYEPGNVRWATPAIQNANRRPYV